MNLESFEVLDGIARIALLSADKLATAIAINREPNQVIPDNGTFLVDLVIGLVEDYLAKSEESLQTTGVVSLPLGAHIRDDEQV